MNTKELDKISDIQMRPEEALTVLICEFIKRHKDVVQYDINKDGSFFIPFLRWNMKQREAFVNRFITDVWNNP